MHFKKSNTPKKNVDPAIDKKGVSDEELKPPRQTTPTSDEAIQVVSDAGEPASAEEKIEGKVTIDEVAGGIVEPGQTVADEGPEKIKKLTEENASLFDQLLRKQAEFENFRKRTEKEKAEFTRYANFEIARELLPVLDGFERALKVEAVEAVDGFKKGMELVYKQLLDALQKAGLKPIEAVGHKFDPHFHQAVVHEERHDVEENIVIEEFRRGYLFQGRLLRAAMVKVATGRKSLSDKEKSTGETVVQ